MRTIAICNLKGGVGKTTITFNLGAELAALGHRVLLIDADAQGCLTECLDARKPGYPTLGDVLRGQATVATAARKTRFRGLEVVVSSPALNRINQRTLAGERVLLARMHREYDYVLIDCPASPGVVMVNALIAADEILAPVQAKGLARPGLARLLRLIREIRNRIVTRRLDLHGILVNQYDEDSRLARSVLESLRDEHGPLVFKTVLRESERLAETTDAKLPIRELAPTSAAAQQIGQVACELIEQRSRQRGHFGRTTSRGSRPKLAPLATTVAGRH